MQHDTAPLRKLCTDCGLSRTDDPKRCGQACQFIQPDYPGLETRVHGRQRQQVTTQHTAQPDELFFGPYQQILSARMASPAEGAQWTGITTRLAEVLLEQGLVDAVIAMAADPNDRWRPRPVLVTQAQDMKQCRGMRMGYAPLLSLVEPALAQGHKRLAVIGIPCQIYALRAIQAQLELLSPHLPHLRGLHQCAVGHHRGLYGRTRPAVVAGAQRTWPSPA